MLYIYIHTHTYIYIHNIHTYTYIYIYTYIIYVYVYTHNINVFIYVWKFGTHLSRLKPKLNCCIQSFSHQIHVAIVVYISNTILALSALLYKHHFSWLTLCKTCKRCLWENRQICELDPPEKWIMLICERIYSSHLFSWIICFHQLINMANVSFPWLIYYNQFTHFCCLKNHSCLLLDKLTN